MMFVSKGPFNNIPALVQVTAWRHPGDKPLSEPMVVSLLTHLCITRPQWVNGNMSNNIIINIHFNDDHMWYCSFQFYDKIKSQLGASRLNIIIYLCMWQLCCQGCASVTWWRHQMKTFFALLALCVGNSLVTGEFPAQRPVTWSFDILLDLHLNKQLSKQSWGWWFQTPLCPLWRHCKNDTCQTRFCGCSSVNDTVNPEAMDAPVSMTLSTLLLWMLQCQ